MSESCSAGDKSVTPDDADAGERVAEHRDALEALAESDLACGWIAETLLETADDGEQGGGSG